MEELNYEELRRIQTKEKGPLLAPIPDNLYELATKMIHRYSVSSINDLREKENVFKILKYIHNRRTEKILMSALNSSKGVEPPVEMTKKEKEFFSQLIIILKEEEQTSGFNNPGEESKQTASSMIKEIKKEATNETTEGISEENKLNKSGSEINIIKDIEEFVGLNGNTYGPYKTGERISIPKEEAETLIKIKAAKQI